MNWTQPNNICSPHNSDASCCRLLSRGMLLAPRTTTPEYSTRQNNLQFELIHLRWFHLVIGVKRSCCQRTNINSSSTFDRLLSKHAVYCLHLHKRYTKEAGRMLVEFACGSFQQFRRWIRFLSFSMPLYRAFSTTKEPLFVNGIRFFIWKFIVFEWTKQFSR